MGPEVEYHTKGKACVKILVGLKKDLRTDNATITKLKGMGKQPITDEDVQKAAMDKGTGTTPKFDGWMTLSAKEEEVTPVFDLAVTKFLGPKPKESADDGNGCSCTLL